MAGKLYQALFFGILTLSMSCSGFNPEEEIIVQEVIIPQESRILIPSSLNSSGSLINNKLVGGDTIYNFIRGYINIVDVAAEIIENSYQRISAIENKGILEFPYTGLDGKTKNVSIRKNYTDSVSSWDYYMEIYSETYANLALKAWWNKSPLEQKIIFKPSSLNTSKMQKHQEALAEIHYKTGDAAVPYEKSMLIAITNLTKVREISYDPEKIIVFAGQIGNSLEISGASSNPDVALLDFYFRGGRTWTFLAHVNTSENIAAVQLALPPSSIESDEVLFTDYLLKEVILDEIKLVYPGNDLLTNIELFSLAGIDGSKLENPAYFGQDGFLSAGEAPSASYSNLIDFEDLTPYTPVNVRDYTIVLK